MNTEFDTRLANLETPCELKLVDLITANSFDKERFARIGEKLLIRIARRKERLRAKLLEESKL